MSKEERIKNFAPWYIGQGYGYKPVFNWDTISNNTIIYIPECGYDDEGIPIYSINWRENAVYTKQMFIDEVKKFNDYWEKENRDKCTSAEFVFETVDWQDPVGLLSEMDDWE